jgi:hypothetical protein
LIQDEYTNHIWSYFLSAKSELPSTAISWIHAFQKEHAVEVRFLRCDNSGENNRLQQELAADTKLYIEFEFTAPYSPQQNGQIERKFTTIWGKVRTTLNGTKLPWSLRNKLWA